MSDGEWATVECFSRLLRLAAGQLWLAFQEAGEVDFIEIAARAGLALGDDEAPTDLAQALDYRIRHLLVDEFQDTSPSQVGLIEKLTRGWTPDDGRTLFVVGDPMQSIYRFRKADVGLFLRVRERGIGDIRLDHLRLFRNNRSYPGIVDWVNAAFPTIFPVEDSPEAGAVRYAESAATRPAREDSEVEVHPLIAREGSDAAGEEACRVLDIIRQARAEAPDERIAVLVRARSHLDALVAEIRRSAPELRFQAVDIEGLDGRQHVQDLLTLFRALHHRADRVHWLALLRAPWCGLKLADLHALAADDRKATIWQLMQDDARLARLSEDGRQRLSHVREVLRLAFADRDRRHPRRWLEGVWLMLGGPRCLEAPEALNDVEALLRADRPAGRRPQPERRNAGRPRRRTVRAGRPAGWRGADDDHPQVQGPRIRHRDPARPAPRDRRQRQQPAAVGRSRRRRRPRTPAGRADEAEGRPPRGLPSGRGQWRGERLRLPEKARSRTRRARRRAPALCRRHARHPQAASGRRRGGRRQQGGRPEAAGRRHAVETVMAGRPARGSRSAGVQPVFAAALARLEPATAPDSGIDPAAFVPPLVRLAEVAVPAALREIPGGPRPPANPVDLDATESGLSLEASVGTLVHRCLELVAKNGLENWSTPGPAADSMVARVATLRPAWQRWLRTQGHGAAEAESGADEALAALSRTLESATGRWLLATHPEAAAEQAWSSRDGNATVNHVIDRTFVADGARWIIDYKTARLPDGELAARAETYRPQLERYAGLFAGDPLPIRMAIFFPLQGILVELPRK